MGRITSHPGRFRGCAILAALLADAPAASVADRPAFPACPALIIRSLAQREAPAGTTDPDPGGTIRVTAADAGDTHVAFLGPILGSMDRRDFAISFACRPDGMAVLATSIRSADFFGAIDKNVLWRPSVTMTLRAGRPHAALTISWRIRLTDGSLPAGFRTPPFPVRRLPIEDTIMIATPAAVP